MITDKHNAFLEVLDEPIGGGKGPLAGMTYALKDNMLALGTKATAGSKILENYNSTYDATVTKRLKASGAMLIGKTNLDEFAMGSSTENSAFGAVKNPWDKTRVAGGSSGGSAAAVAAGLVDFALGSDTGGSIRQPASFCGVVGLKPTYGRVSRYGLIAMASSLDQIGTFTRTVEDAARVLNIIGGHDLLDSTSLDLPMPDLTKALKSAAKLTIGIPEEYFGAGIEPGVLKKVNDAVKLMEKNGFKTKKISLPNARYALAAYYIIMPVEVASNLSRYDGIKYGYSVEREEGFEDLSVTDIIKESRARGFGPEAKRRIILGTYASSSGYYDAYYLKAQKVRTLIINDFRQAFRGVDVIVTPTTPELAFKFGEKSDDPVKMYKSDMLTVTANIAGIPAISVPCGLVDGLPVGIQFMADLTKEDVLLNVAYRYEQLRGEWKGVV